MKLFQLFSVIFVTSLALIGCSDGGTQRVPGYQCPTDYKAVELPGQKVWEKGNNESAIEAGTYAYERADMIYTERGPKGLIIHVQDTRMKDGTFKPSVNCIRNGQTLNDNPDISGSAVLASKILAKAGANAEVEVKELLFKMVDGRLTADSKALEATDSLSKAYEGKDQEFYLIENPNKVDYEIRSTFSDNKGDYVVSVRFRKTP